MRKKSISLSEGGRSELNLARVLADLTLVGQIKRWLENNDFWKYEEFWEKGVPGR